MNWNPKLSGDITRDGGADDLLSTPTGLGNSVSAGPEGTAHRASGPIGQSVAYQESISNRRRVGSRQSVTCGK